MEIARNFLKVIAFKELRKSLRERRVWNKEQCNKIQGRVWPSVSVFGEDVNEIIRKW